jgi:hypothetical protein
MHETYTLPITAAVALALLVVLRWIFTPRRKHRDPAPHAPRAAGAGAGGEVVECCFVIELPELGGRRRVEALGHRLFALCEFEGE